MGNGPAKRRFTTMDEYIDTFPEHVRDRLQTVRRTIKEVAPDANETISYQIPTFKLNGMNLIYFSAAKNHIALYPRTAEMEAAIAELSPYKSGKGTIQLPLNQPLPLPLIRQIVAFRLKELGLPSHHPTTQ
jgi:uncharacterized protein YdhG (YjbR/CyaY superfamily)